MQCGLTCWRQTSAASIAQPHEPAHPQAERRNKLQEANSRKSHSGSGRGRQRALRVGKRAAVTLRFGVRAATARIGGQRRCAD
jgi:hypothetical protein